VPGTTQLNHNPASAARPTT